MTMMISSKKSGTTRQETCLSAKEIFAKEEEIVVLCLGQLVSLFMKQGVRELFYFFHKTTNQLVSLFMKPGVREFFYGTGRYWLFYGLQGGEDP